MLLYLVRHGKAEQNAPNDDARQLTVRGTEDVQQMGAALARMGVRTDEVRHSGLVRAEQTANILHESLGGQLIAWAGLRSGDDVTLAASRLPASAGVEIMLVTHMPFVTRLASYLLSGNPDAQFLHFRTAAVACLSGMGAEWQLEWFLEPHILPAVSNTAPPPS